MFSFVATTVPAIVVTGGVLMLALERTGLGLLLIAAGVATHVSAIFLRRI